MRGNGRISVIVSRKLFIMMNNDAALLREEVERVLGDPTSWPQPVEFYDSLALCALNSSIH